jgi:putative Holliday junction resolvase
MYNAGGMTDVDAKCILAVDWGSKRIGIAISDPSAKFARPLGVIYHSSRTEDAQRIFALCVENSVKAIIMGVTFDDENILTPNGRSASRLAEEISILFGKQVILWDESFTTKAAKQLQLEKGISRKKRKGHQDEMAAVMLLEDYLEKTSNE